jgi:hypothetical protein
MNPSDQKDNPWSFVGIGVMICLILLGLGGCFWISARDSNQPLIVIKLE